MTDMYNKKCTIHFSVADELSPAVGNNSRITEIALILRKLISSNLQPLSYFPFVQNFQRIIK